MQRGAADGTAQLRCNAQSHSRQFGAAARHRRVHARAAHRDLLGRDRVPGRPNLVLAYVFTSLLVIAVLSTVWNGREVASPVLVALVWAIVSLARKVGEPPSKDRRARTWKKNKAGATMRIPKRALRHSARAPLARQAPAENRKVGRVKAIVAAAAPLTRAVTNRLGAPSPTSAGHRPPAQCR